MDASATKPDLSKAELTRSERDTLKAIWRLTSAPGHDGTARTGDLASSLQLSPGTMTATVKRLADRGLAIHTPYRGVELTGDGRRLAMAVIRRHRIVERFLADMLGYGWSEADSLAPSFEHQLPQEVEDRLWVALDRPATCPHGFPIPGAGTEGLPVMQSLYELEPGDRAVVALPGSTDAAIARFLDDLGVRPGVEVRVTEKHPFDGPLVVSVVTLEGQRPDGAPSGPVPSGDPITLGDPVTLGDKVARQILVRPPAASSTDATSDTDSTTAWRIREGDAGSGTRKEHRDT